MLRDVPSRIIVVTTLCISSLFPAAAQAQVAFGCGTDGGITIADPHVRFVDPAVRRRNPTPTVALGIDVSAYYLPSSAIAIGLALSPSFFAAGPEPSPGINFAIGPRFVWRPGRLHLAADVAFVASAYEDRCQVDDASEPRACPPTHASEAAAPGFGVGLASLVRVASFEMVDVLVGPAFRYQSARYALTDAAGSFVLRDFQAVFAVRAFVDLAKAAAAQHQLP